MLVRERIEQLVDPNTALLELSPLAAWGTQDTVGAGIVNVIGVVENTLVAISGTDMTYRGGSANPTSWRKQQRFYEIVKENRLPLILLNESAGADLPRQADLFIQGGAELPRPHPDVEDGHPVDHARVRTEHRRRCVHAGDERLHGVRQGPRHGLPRRPAAREDGDRRDRRRGDARRRRDALAHERAVRLPRRRRDRRRCASPRQIVRHLRWQAARAGPDANPPTIRCTTLPNCSAVRRPTCASRSTSARCSPGCSTAAGSRSSSRCSATSWCAAGDRSAGSRSACSATTGSCSPRRPKKGSQFIQLCNRTNTPLLFLHNITGFMVGSKAEQGGIIVNGAKMINAVSNSTVPHFNLMVGASYGAGNYGMAGKAYNPRLIFSWPNHRIAVMGPKQLAGVMEIVARNAAAGRGIEVDEDAIAAQTAALEAQIEHESTALYSTGRIWDDGIIHPADSRTVMGIALAAAHSNVDRGRHRVRRLEALMTIATPAHRQPWRDRRARSPAPRRGSASRPSACTPSPTPTRCTSTRSTSPSRSAGRRRPSRTCAVTRSSQAALRTGCRRHPSRATASSPRTPTFAQAVIDAGLIWVGPTPDQIRLLGDKVAAKKAAIEAGVPTAPIHEIVDGAVPDGVSFPALVKAAAGGGGRGMRIVRVGRRARRRRSRRRHARPLSAFGDGTRVRRAVHRARSPRRGPDHGRHARQRGPPRRTRVLDPAPQPEGHRGVAVAEHLGRDPAARCAMARSRSPASRLRRTPAPSSSSSATTARSTSSRSTRACRSSTR